MRAWGGVHAVPCVGKQAASGHVLTQSSRAKSFACCSPRPSPLAPLPPFTSHTPHPTPHPTPPPTPPHHTTHTSPPPHLAPHPNRHIGFIALMLPDACLVHAARHPADTALSCYAQPFEGRGTPWASNLTSEWRWWRWWWRHDGMMVVALMGSGGVKRGGYSEMVLCELLPSLPPCC